MPWQETHVMDERVRFIGKILEGGWRMSELCRAFGISRKTGYKILNRYRSEGMSGLEDRSRARHSHPNAVSDEVVNLIVSAKRWKPTWGPRKLLGVIAKKHPEVQLPAISTAGEVLKRAGLVKPRGRRRQKAVPSKQPMVAAGSPNDVWCADHKGWFKTQDGTRCEPLTITDSFSRYLLCCRIVGGTGYVEARREFEMVVQQYGLPEAIRTDNGSPFASVGVAGLSQLSVWWVRLAIMPQRIEPGHPEQNPSHERMHRTLKEDAISPPSFDPVSQQAAFDRFEKEFNSERPHESLGDTTPVEHYRPSFRSFPETLPEMLYPADFEIRKVNPSGAFKWQGRYYYLGEVLSGQTIGLGRNYHDDRSEIHFGSLILGILDEKRQKILKHRVITPRT